MHQQSASVVDTNGVFYRLLQWSGYSSRSAVCLSPGVCSYNSLTSLHSSAATEIRLSFSQGCRSATLHSNRGLILQFFQHEQIFSTRSYSIGSVGNSGSIASRPKSVRPSHAATSFQCQCRCQSKVFNVQARIAELLRSPPRRSRLTELYLEQGRI